MRVIIHYECSACKRRNYTSKKNKSKHSEKMKVSKHCRFCRKHTLHEETK
ncbi:MAG TPA: 50S ribosomal protein L33 [Deltaproteobacteria bacterium]|nr:50S ribosomal protein L33 [Deltaproteobacteria bacterium]